MARLPHEANFGATHPFVRLVVLVVGPTDEEVAATKTVGEMGHSLSSLLIHPLLVEELHKASTAEEFKGAILKFLESGVVEEHMKLTREKELEERDRLSCSRCKPLLGGIWNDLARRLPFYLSDWKDGLWGFKAIRKTAAATLFIYFSCLLPAMIFGIVNHINTEGAIDVKRTVLSQAIGGIIFSLVGGSPMVVLLSTAPMALYTKLVFDLSVQFGFPFYALFGWVGIFTGLFLVAFAVLEVSVVMKWSSRFTEETFGVFIAIAFSYSAILALVREFTENFYGCGNDCQQELPLYFLILLVFTTYVGVWLFSMRNTIYFTPTIRGILADFALPLSVAAGTVLGALIFYPVDAEPFVYEDQSPFYLVPLLSLPIWAIFIAIVLGFFLSLLFFIDQNISCMLMNAKGNKMVKGHSYHLDLYVMGIITILNSTLGLPWINPAIPNSPLHVIIMADTENVFVDGSVRRRVLRSRESRIAPLLSHIMIFATTFTIPTPLQVIPVPVLYAVFLFLALTGLPGNKLFERITLFFTESRRYPANSYVRWVPKRVLHAFTIVEVLCVLMLCVAGFTPVDIFQVFLPVAIILLLPIRHLIVSRLFRKEHLDALEH